MFHNFRWKRYLVMLVLLYAMLLSSTPVYAARAVLVTEGPDDDPRCLEQNNCYTSFRDVFAAIQLLPEDPNDPIIIQVGTIFTEPPGTPTFYSGPLVINRSIHLVAVNQNVTISGSGFRPITIDGTDATKPINVRISGFEIEGGDATTPNAPETEQIQPRIGGGILVQNASPTIENNIIHGNVASSDEADGFGGGIAVLGGAPVIRNNIVRENTAALLSGRRGHGGGISISSSAAQVAYNQIVNNVAGGYQQGIGGGIYINRDPVGEARVQLVGNHILGNSAQALNGVGQGGGIYTFASSPTFANNVIAQNTDSAGAGGTLSDGGQLTFINNTIADNVSTDSDVRAGVILRVGAVLMATNTIIAGHGTGVYAGGAEQGLPATRAELSHTLFFPDTQQKFQGDGTIIDEAARDGDPRFVNTGAAQPDYHIAVDSAARDWAAKTNMPTDIDHVPRVIGLPDVGADEYTIDSFFPLAQR